jgi:competence protein ComEC
LREPLLLPAISIAGGICLGRFVPFGTTQILVVFAALCVVAGIARRRCARWLFMVAANLALLAGGATIATVRKPEPRPSIDAKPDEVVTFSGCVVQPSTFAQDREHFTLELAPRARANVSVILRDGEQGPKLAYGRRVELDGKIRATRNYGNPGSFDYETYLARQDVYWTASTHPRDIRVERGRCGSPFLAGIFALRVAALDRLQRVFAGDAYATGILDATLIGDKTGMERVWTDRYRRTGTYHMLVIDGLHVTVVAAVLLFLLRVCAVDELRALIVAALVAWLYATVAGCAVPAIRAASGFNLYVAGRWFYRRSRVLNLVAAIALAYLLWDPTQLFDASFQLSFLAVLAIGALAIPIIEITSRVYRAVPRDLADRDRDIHLPPKAAELRVELRLLAETAAVWTRVPERALLAAFGLAVRCALWAYDMAVISAVLQLALALPAIVYFHHVSLTGISANLFIVPLLSAVIPVGFAAILTGWRWVAALARGLLMISERIADWHMRFEMTAGIPDPPLWLSLLFIAAVVALAIGLRRKLRYRWGAATLALALCAGLIWWPERPDIAHGRLELDAIDVGQGDGLMVAFPDGKIMLVDSGGIPSYGRKTKPNIDIGDDVVSPYLWTRHIRHVDVIVATHGHEDHIGGMRALVENYRPRELWTGATVHNETWTGVLAAARRVGARVVARHEGEVIHYGGTEIDILAPFSDYRTGKTAKNDDSLAFRIRYGEDNFLLTGDIEAPIEARMIADGILTRTTVLKVAHHGSKTSSIEPFLDITRPEVALISAGYYNPFHHPSPQVLARLAEHHTVVYRTDLEGLISVSTDGRRLSIATYRRGE